MARFSSEAGSYQNACNLIKALRLANIEANITAGGVSIYCEPDQVNKARSICDDFEASFEAGLTAHQESVILTCKGGAEKIGAINDYANAALKLSRTLN